MYFCSLTKDGVPGTKVVADVANSTNRLVHAGCSYACDHFLVGHGGRPLHVDDADLMVFLLGRSWPEPSYWRCV